jgi:hypothetical protein
MKDVGEDVMKRHAQRVVTGGAETTATQRAVEASLAEAALYRDLHQCYARLHDLVGQRGAAEIQEETARAEAVLSQLQEVAETLGPVREGRLEGVDRAVALRLERLWAETATWLQKTVDLRANLLTALASARSETQRALSTLGGARVALEHYRSPRDQRPRFQCQRV